VFYRAAWWMHALHACVHACTRCMHACISWIRESCLSVRLSVCQNWPTLQRGLSAIAELLVWGAAYQMSQSASMTSRLELLFA